MPRSARTPRRDTGPTAYTPDWPAVRLAILADRWYTCERCGDADPLAEGEGRLSEVLQVHHRNRNKRDNDPANLEVLCRRCHCTEHGIAWYPHYARKRPRGRGRLRIRMRRDDAKGANACGS